MKNDLKRLFFQLNLISIRHTQQTQLNIVANIRIHSIAQLKISKEKWLEEEVEVFIEYGGEETNESLFNNEAQFPKIAVEAEIEAELM